MFHPSPVLQTSSMVGRRLFDSGLIAVVLPTGLSACDRLSSPGASTVFKGIDISGAPYGRGFSPTDFNGTHRSLADYQGKVVMLCFGFVQCPDVCPTALTRASAVMQQLGAAAPQVQLLFVTVDPERDTPELLRGYMATLDPSFVALTGRAEEIKTAADEFRVFFKKVPTGNRYTMGHSALTSFRPPGPHPFGAAPRTEHRGLHRRHPPLAGREAGVI